MYIFIIYLKLYWKQEKTSDCENPSHMQYFTYNSVIWESLTSTHEEKKLLLFAYFRRFFLTREVRHNKYVLTRNFFLLPLLQLEFRLSVWLIANHKKNTNFIFISQTYWHIGIITIVKNLIYFFLCISIWNVRRRYASIYMGVEYIHVYYT